MMAPRTIQLVARDTAAGEAWDKLAMELYFWKWKPIRFVRVDENFSRDFIKVQIY